MAILKANDKVSNYTVQTLIKSNLYTETYRVVDENNTPFFLKLFVLKRVPKQLINPETSTIKEIEYCRNIKHKNIVSFIDTGNIVAEESDCQYYITSYFNGSILSDYIQREGTLNETKALTIFRGILNGLQYLHTLTPCLCHNDLDTSNVILLGTDNNEAEIIDLGHLSERCCGTVWFDTTDINPLFHANETRVRIFDEQSDIFSACMILYTMISGKVAWDCELNKNATYKEQFDELWMYRKSHKLDVASLTVSDKTKYILSKGLELKSTDRFGSVGEIITVLDSNVSQSTNDKFTRDEHEKPHEHAQQSPNYVEFPIKKGTGNGFADIAGMQALKDDLNKKVIFTIKNKDIAEQYRITPPSGMLLYGPPGCGKTFFAEKFAEETGFNYLLVKSSDLASSYVHGSQEKIRQLFDQAEKNSPIVVCFDEFDALVPDRTWNNVSAEEVNEFLSQMNNCSKRGIFIVATSNRPDKIDSAVLRTGRIDKMVYVPLPDYEARKEMFSLYLKERPQEKGIDIEYLAKKTEGYIASDIAYIVNDSAMIAAYSREKITNQLLLTSLNNTSPSLRSDIINQYDEIKQKMQDKQRRTLVDDIRVNPW